MSRGLEQHADSNPASKFVALVPRPALMIVYAVGALDSGVEFLREIGGIPSPSPELTRRSPASFTDHGNKCLDKAIFMLPGVPF